MGIYDYDYEEELDEEDERKALDKNLATMRAMDTKIEKALGKGLITEKEGEFLNKKFIKLCKKVSLNKWYNYRGLHKSIEVIKDIFDDIEDYDANIEPEDKAKYMEILERIEKA